MFVNKVTSMEQLSKVGFLRYSQTIRLEWFARDKRSSLFGPFTSCEGKGFVNTTALSFILKVFFLKKKFF